MWTNKLNGKKYIRELNTVVIAPNNKHINNIVELYSIKGDERINKYTPAVHLCWLFPNKTWLY